MFWGVPEPGRAAVENAGQEEEHEHDHEHGHDHEHHHHDHEFSEVVFRTDGVMDRKGLDAFLSRLPENVDRAKGQVVFPGETLYLDVVGDEISWRLPRLHRQEARRKEPAGRPQGTRAPRIGTFRPPKKQGLPESLHAGGRCPDSSTGTVLETGQKIFVIFSLFA